MAIRIDDPNGPKISDNVLPEDQTRMRILLKCRSLGCEQEMLQIWQKFDRLMRNCKNESERKGIVKLGVYETYALLGKGGKLFVQNELIYVDKDDSSNTEEDKKIII